MSELSHQMKQHPWLAELVGLLKQIAIAQLFGHSQDEKLAIVNHPAFAADEPAPVVETVTAAPVAAAPAPIDYDALAAALRRQAAQV